jgi:hypothetical protein
MRHTFTFFLRIITHIIHITLSAKPPRFRSVMEADRLIEAFPLAAPGPPPGPELQRAARPGTVLWFYVTYPAKDIARICLHRTFFAHALLEATNDGGTGNPELGPHAHSFRRAADSSVAILKWALEQFELIPEFCCVAWYTWTYSFAGAVRICVFPTDDVLTCSAS